MKRIFLVLLSCSVLNCFGATKTWIASGLAGNLASTALNWSGLSAPQPGDDIVFDGSSVANCTWDLGNAASISLLSGYTGSFSFSNNTLRTISGNLTIVNGTFNSSSGILRVGGISFSGGTFNHNNGTVSLLVGGGATSVISGAITFNNLNLRDDNTSTGLQRNVNFGNSITNTLRLDETTNFELWGYQGNINIRSTLNVSTANNTGIPTNNTAIFTFSGSGPITITGSGLGESKLPNLLFNTSGTISMTGNVNVQGDWTGTQGTLSVGSSTQNFYGASAVISGTAAAFDNLNIQSGAGVTLPPAEVKIGGSITQTGTLTFQPTSALGFNGTGSQSFTLGGVTLAAINVYDTGTPTRSVNLSGALNVLDSVKVEANTVLNTGGGLTLKSNSTLTARVAKSNGVISGSVTVETFIPGGATGWSNLGVRGVTGQSVANWDTYVSSGGANGIPMTCSLCSYPSSVLGSWFNSIQGWDETSGAYDSLTVNTALNPGVGYWVYVGDGLTTTNGLTLINQGAVAQSNISVPVTMAGTGANQGFNLVANPYPSPISYQQLLQYILNVGDFTSAMYIWNTDLSSGAGGFVSYNGTGISSPSGFNGDVIAGGQGFYVEYVGNGFGLGLLNFTEDMKVDNSGGASPLLRSATSNTLSYFRLKLAGTDDEDETVISINQDATLNYDGKFDAKKIFQTPGYVGYPGNYTLYTTISSKDADNNDYSINTLPALTKKRTVPLLVRVSASGTYTISSFDFQNFTNCLILVDKLDNSYHDLKAGPYVFTISDTTNTPRFELVLCKDEGYASVGIAENTSSHSIVINQDAQGAFVKTDFEESTKATISVYNLIGQKLTEDIEVEGKITNTPLNLNVHNQVVLIRVVTDKENITKKIVLH